MLVCHPDGCGVSSLTCHRFAITVLGVLHVLHGKGTNITLRILAHPAARTPLQYAVEAASTRLHRCSGLSRGLGCPCCVGQCMLTAGGASRQNPRQAHSDYPLIGLSAEEYNVCIQSISQPQTLCVYKSLVPCFWQFSVRVEIYADCILKPFHKNFSTQPTMCPLDPNVAVSV